MGAAKATLILVGTATGLGAVLAYSPPHHALAFGGLGGGNLGGGATPSTGTTPPASLTVTPSATPTPTPPVSTPTPTPSEKKTTPPAPKKTTPPPAAKKVVVPKKTQPAAPKLVNGTFSGATSNTVYGPVQVQIDVKNSKIVAARALQLPTSTPRDQEINAQAIPILVQETIAASSSNIQGVTGASYTAQGWYDSLVSALNSAGL